MLRIDLSGLSRAELRRLLAAAEARGQASLAETLRAELAGRAAGKGAAPAPAPIAFDDDEPGPIMAPEDPLPLAFEQTGRPASPARRWPIGLAAVAVLAVGGATAWGVSGTPGWPGAEAEPPALRAMTIRSATPPVPAAAQPPQSAPPGEPPPPEPPAAEPPAPEPTPQATAATVASAPEPGPRRLDPCARPPTPADRLLCNDLALNLLARELRDAYGRAMSAGADPVALQESQTAWRRMRDPVSDPHVLVQVYDKRIRELKSLVAETPRPVVAVAAPVPQED